MLALYFLWHAIDCVDANDVGRLLFSITLILISFAGWLTCAGSTGGVQVAAGWFAFVAAATAMFAVQGFV
jgi:hypothetical protein